MKLISMTSFIEEQEKILRIEIESPGTTSEDLKSMVQFINRITNYSKFLRQPLTLGMFVPVDEEGNVLEDPELHGETTAHLEEWGIKQVKFNKAKEKVLFKGIELKSKTEYSWMFSINRKFPFIIRKTMIVEQLLIYSIKLELTPYALKQIGL